MIKFSLEYINNGEGIIEISEPVGFDSSSFVLKQEEKRYGRDVSFSEGSQELTFYRLGNHTFDLLIYYYNTFGWESKVNLIIDLDGIENVVGTLDFANASTDEIEFFKCNVIQDSKEILLKRRSDVKVDIFSDKDVDGNDIEPVKTFSVLLPPKPIVQISKWELSKIFTGSTSRSQLGGGADNRYFMPVQKLVEFGIDKSFVPFRIKSKDVIDAEYIRAENNIKDLVITIENFDFKITGDSDGGGNGNIDFRLIIATGDVAKPSELHENVMFAGSISDSGSFSKKETFTHTIPFLARNNSVFIYLFVRTRKTSLLGTVESFITINSWNIIARGTTVSFNTLLKGVRLIDLVKQNVKSVSGLNVVFPFADVNGEMYNQFVFNGTGLRNRNDKPFFSTFDDIVDWMSEINGDYEVTDSQNVFIGLYADFYKNKEIARYDRVQFEGYERKNNERYQINTINWKYSKYQSLKENESENTSDVINGEAQFLVRSQLVENKKDIKVPYVRDAFYIEEQKRKAIEVSDNTSTQDDDTVFIIDSVELNQSLSFEESALLRHSFNVDENVLILTNEGDFDFILLGIATGDTFEIKGSDLNAGTYIVADVVERSIKLQNNGTLAENKDGDRITIFKYTLPVGRVSHKSRGLEGIDAFEGVLVREDFANIFYSLKRNILRFWSTYFATANIFTKKEIGNTFYKNNPNVKIEINDLQTVEGDNIEINDVTPLLSPFVITATIIGDFNDYVQIKNKIKTDRGYIRTFDNVGNPIKLYPKRIEKLNEKDEIKIIGEEKYDGSVVNITSTGLGFVTLNNEIFTRKIKYEIINEKLNIFDEDKMLLFKPIFWNNVSVNNKKPVDKKELEEWLRLIS